MSQSKTLDWNRHPKVGPVERCMKILEGHDGPMLMRELRERAAVQPAAMTRIKPQLRALGYVIEERSRRNGNVVYSLTDELLVEVLAQLDQKPMTIAELVDRTSGQKTRIQSLLLSLVVAGLVTRPDGHTYERKELV